MGDAFNCHAGANIRVALLADKSSEDIEINCTALLSVNTLYIWATQGIFHGTASN